MGEYYANIRNIIKITMLAYNAHDMKLITRTCLVLEEIKKLIGVLKTNYNTDSMGRARSTDQ